ARRGRPLRRPGRPLQPRPRLRGPARDMNAKARSELIGIGALVIGLFLGLTVLRLPVTGTWGDRLGALLWRLFGLGAAVLPLAGVGWALAAFERFGTLSSGRAAALGAGLLLLLPYGIGIALGARFPADYAAWTPLERPVGTAGGALVGLFALSALGILTVGWHPLVVLRSRETGRASREAATPPGKAPDASAGPSAVASSASRPPKARKSAAERTPPASRLPPPVPPGVLIPPIELLTPPPPE